MPSNPENIVICLPGLSEFSEKYFEEAREALERNNGFIALDWFGQGGSGRYFPNSRKRHSAGFAEDVKDLNTLIIDFARASGMPDVPLLMLAHSMGANIGLRYLEEHPNVIATAALSAPMLALKVFEKAPPEAAAILTGILARVAGSSFAPGYSEEEATRTHDDDLALSKDPVRVHIHEAWINAKPELRSGGITNRWLHEAQSSCIQVSKPSALARVETPVLVGIAGEEHLIDNVRLRKIANMLPNAQILEFPDARHEIMKEREGIRRPFLDNFYKLAAESRLNALEP